MTVIGLLRLSLFDSSLSTTTSMTSQLLPGLAMQHSRSHIFHPQTTTSPSPPSSHSSPIAPPTKAPATLPPPTTNSIWSSHSSPNPGGFRPTETAGNEGVASKFFSSRTSSIGSNNSASSASPPRWATQPQPSNHVQIQSPQFHRPSYPAPIVQDQQPEVRYEYTRSNLPMTSTERELHVVLPEPWMDAPYVFQLAHTQGWDITDVRMLSSGAVLVFATAQGAARAFAQVNGSIEGVNWTGTNARVQAHWAGAVGRANEEEAQSYSSRPVGGSGGGGGNSNASKQLEFSIFVGDLAPETTNADLVAVFRNPLLGLRADREPRVIRPFTSCRSAKIMVSPESGISKGYGFVRFTDEADQQRALIEMQGLYCLSRPMRLSHATAKSKPTGPNGSALNPNGSNGGEYSSFDDIDMYSFNHPGQLGRMQEAHSREMSGPPADVYGRFGRHSMSGPDSYMPRGGDGGPPRSRSVDAEELFGGIGVDTRALGVESGRVLGVEGSRALGGALGSEGTRATGGGLSEGARLESARALLGVLNSADPYNTTVFVGGLSGLIAEETLRGFFAPFGEIHYVKIPPGKGCGFVQFVRKADAERAIERMQGFPIGGGKIRLSWGRSQSDKAAQAAAQAAQLGLNLGGLHLNSLSAADSARLFQTLEALGYSSVPTGSKTGAGASGSAYQPQQSGNSYPQGGSGFTSPQFYEQQGMFSPGGVHHSGQGGFQVSQPFSPTQSFVPSSSPPTSVSPQQGSFNKAQHGQFGMPAQQTQFAPQPSLYEPSSVGLSRAYTTVGSGFQPFSSEPSSIGRPNERPSVGSVQMGHSASATAHPATQPYSTRHSLAFEPEAFGLQARERQLTAPAHASGPNPNMKSLNLGVAGMNLSQRREFGLDGGPLSAPLGGGRNLNMTTNGSNNGGMKPSVSDNNVYIH